MNTAVLDKIRKLLRLGKSSNANEAALALSRAFELARKHQIDLDSVNLDDEEIERLLIKVGARVPFERLRILGLVKHFFRVEIVVCRPNVAFIGRQTDVMIARYAHDFLLRSLRAGVAAFKAESRLKLSETRRKSYIQGFIYGIADKLEATSQTLALENSRFALVATDADPRVQAAAAALYPGTVNMPIVKPRLDKNAMISGWCDGKQVDVRTPLSGPAAPTLPARSPAEQMSLF